MRTPSSDNSFSEFYYRFKKQRKEFCKFKIDKLFHTINLDEKYEEEKEKTALRIWNPSFDDVKTILDTQFNKLYSRLNDEKVEITEELYSQIQNDDSSLYKLYELHHAFYVFKDLLLQLITDSRFCLTNVLYEYSVNKIQMIKLIDKINQINKDSYNIEEKVFDIETYKYIDIFEPNRKVNFEILLSSINITRYLDAYTTNEDELYIHPNMTNNFGERVYEPTNNEYRFSALYPIEE